MNLNFIGCNMCTAAMVYLEDVRKKIKQGKCFLGPIIRLNIKNDAPVPAQASVCGVCMCFSKQFVLSFCV